MNTKSLAIPLFVLLVAYLHAIPLVIISSTVNGAYTPLTANGLSPYGRDEGYAYAPEVNYLLKGNLKIGEVYVKEYANHATPFIGETFPAHLLALISRITGSLETSFKVADIIFPPIIFLLFYAITRLFIKNWFFAVVISFIATVSRDIIAVIPYPHETIQLLFYQEGQTFPLFLSRALHPQVTYPFFLLFLLSILWQVKDNKNFKKILLSGTLLGILFYCYVFYWSYALFLLFLLFFYAIVTRKKTLAVTLVSIGLLGLFLSAPYLLTMLEFYTSEVSIDFLHKASLPDFPLPLTLARYLLIAITFWYIFKKNVYASVFSVILLSGILVAPIAKVTLGQDLETFHYLRRALMPLATIAFFAIIFRLISQRKNLSKVVASCLILVFFLYALNTSIVSSTVTASAHVKNESERAVFEWFKKNTSSEATIGSLDTDFNLFIPVYTSNYTYFPPADRTVMPTKEGVERFIYLANLTGLNPQMQKEFILENLSYLFIYQAYNRQHALDPNSPKRLEADKRIDALSSGESIKIPSPDYVVITPKHLKDTAPNLAKLSPVVTINDYLIFKLKRQSE